jgi:hypothetical protein
MRDCATLFGPPVKGPSVEKTLDLSGWQRVAHLGNPLRLKIFQSHIPLFVWIFFSLSLLLFSVGLGLLKGALERLMLRGPLLSGSAFL